MSLSGLDLLLFHAINDLCGKSETFDLIVGSLDISALKSLAIVTTFGALWHLPSKDQYRQREILLMLFVTVAASLVLNRTISLIVPFRLRPMSAMDVGYNSPLKSHHTDLESWSSFPSDNATLLFAVATCFWFVSRRWAFWFAMFSGVALLARIYLGVHYPFDVVVGAALGVGVALALLGEPVRAIIARPLLAWERRAPAYFCGLLFAALFEMATLFSLTRFFGKAALRLLG